MTYRAYVDMELFFAITGSVLNYAVRFGSPVLKLRIYFLNASPDFRLT